MSATAIARWAHIGRLQRLHPSVYAVGHRRIQQNGWRMAGLLTAGTGAHLAHWTSLAVLGLARDRSVVHVIPVGRRGTTARGIRVHRTALDPADVTVHGGFPITRFERSIIDVAPSTSDRRLGALLDDALRAGVYDHHRMLLALDRAFGRRSIARVTTAVARMGDDGVLFRSGTERKLRDRLVNEGIRRPLVNVPIARGDGSYYELDLVWPELLLNVEIDGPHHLLPHQKAEDAIRDAWLRGRGYRVERFPVERVDRVVAAVIDEIRRLVESFARK